MASHQLIWVGSHCLFTFRVKAKLVHVTKIDRNATRWRLLVAKIGTSAPQNISIPSFIKIHPVLAEIGPPPYPSLWTPPCSHRKRERTLVVLHIFHPHPITKLFWKFHQNWPSRFFFTRENVTRTYFPIQNALEGKFTVSFAASLTKVCCCRSRWYEFTSRRSGPSPMLRWGIYFRSKCGVRRSRNTSRTRRTWRMQCDGCFSMRGCASSKEIFLWNFISWLGHKKFGQNLDNRCLIRLAFTVSMTRARNKVQKLFTKNLFFFTERSMTNWVEKCIPQYSTNGSKTILQAVWVAKPFWTRKRKNYLSSISSSDTDVCGPWTTKNFVLKLVACWLRSGKRTSNFMAEYLVSFWEKGKKKFLFG